MQKFCKGEYEMKYKAVSVCMHGIVNEVDNSKCKIHNNKIPIFFFVFISSDAKY